MDKNYRIGVVKMLPVDFAPLAERLKGLRKLHDKLQKHIAAFLGVTERHYRLCEAGKVDLPSSKLISLARYFNVSVDYLVGDSNLAFRSFVNNDGGNDETFGGDYDAWESKLLIEAQKKGFIIPNVGKGIDIFTHINVMVMQNRHLIKNFGAVFFQVEEMREISVKGNNHEKFWEKLNKLLRNHKAIRPMIDPLIVRLLMFEYRIERHVS